MGLCRGWCGRGCGGRCAAFLFSPVANSNEFKYVLRASVHAPPRALPDPPPTKPLSQGESAHHCHLHSGAPLRAKAGAVYTKLESSSRAWLTDPREGHVVVVLSYRQRGYIDEETTGERLSHAGPTGSRWGVRPLGTPGVTWAGAVLRGVHGRAGAQPSGWRSPFCLELVTTVSPKRERIKIMRSS